MPKTKSKFVIQKWNEHDWKDVVDQGIEDTAGAIRCIREKEMVGEFRIISVRAHVTTEEKTTLNVDVQRMTTDDD